MLKVFAIISMIFDHIGFRYLYSSFLYEYFRYIGRIAFPLFAGLISYNFLYRTSNKLKYLKNLFLFSIISQIPFMLFVESFEFNIFFQYFFSMLVFYTIELKQYRYSFVLFVTFLIFSIFADYGIIGFLFSLYLFFYFKYYYNDNLKLKFIMNFVLYFFIISLLYNFDNQNFYFYSTISFFIFILLYFLPIIENNFNKNYWQFVNNKYKYIFYWFYPIHMLLLIIF